MRRSTVPRPPRNTSAAPAPPSLTAAFTPIVHDQLAKLGVIKQYNSVIQSTPGGSAMAVKFDLDKYVVGKTLDGLFYTLGQEEKKIRKDPAAQTTALLRTVFGRR